MSFDRDRRPEPRGYFESEGLTLKGPGKWKTTICNFHGGSDSMRVNVATGAWVCMSCGEKGGDVLAFHMASHGLEFVDAAKALGCWVEDGRPLRPQKPAPLPPRAALQVLAFEATLAAVAAGNVAHGVTLTEPDRFRLLTAAGRINRLVEAYA
ncbi:CHC2 zinc finger domain-containing protein [Hydrogenophaga sp.]|uniref:CHC2 zinc finger domain-containing protein n=1 Tax=Hydrogenophaga sp. TaxID=1904254 RepID=UPI003F72F255